MSSEYVRMTEAERLNNLKDDAIRRNEERKKAEQLRQEEDRKKNEELARLRAQLAVQKELSDRDQEIARLRSELANSQKPAAPQQKPAVHQMKEVKYANASGSDYETLKKTIYGHAKMEGEECQKAVAFVVLNRARANQPYWGGSSITDVCRKPYQFWPWNDKNDVHIDDWNKYNSIDAWLPALLNGQIADNTNGSDHLLPNWERQDWLSNVDHRASHGNFNFYKAKWL